MNIRRAGENNNILVLGHRGEPMKEIENTLPSFLRAIDDGADGVELDVHLTKDNRLAVIHDFSTKRVFGVDKEVESLTLDELKEISSEIPSLEEVFSALGPVYYDIEIKAELSFDKKLISVLTETLNRYPEIKKNVIVSSFNPIAMRLFYSMNKDNGYPLGIIFEGPPTSLPSILQKGQGRILFPCDILKPKWDIAEKCKKQQDRYMIMPWAVDSPEVVDRMLPLEPIAVITNEADKIVNYLFSKGLKN